MNLGCPNDPPCGHYWHDIYEPGDPYPTCCHEGCKCGHPGSADVVIHNGRRIVARTDPVIGVTAELLDEVFADVWDGETLTLDTAGEYRYRLLRRDPKDERVFIFGRVKP